LYKYQNIVHRMKYTNFNEKVDVDSMSGM